MSARASVVYQFGDFLVDVQDRRLTCCGQPVALQDKPFDALVELVENAGRLVTREELAAALWGPGTYVDAQSGLNTAVKKLRVALGDAASEPRWIETVPRQGYRLLAPVEKSVRVPPATSPARRPRRPTRWLWPLANCAVGLLAGLLAGPALRGDRALPPSSGTAPAAGVTLRCAGETTVRVAVLPFEEDGAAAERSERLASALGDEVIGALWEVDSLRLAARAVPRAEAVSPADADVVLAGRLRTRSGNLELVVRLLDPERMETVWERAFEAPDDEPYLLRSEVASSVASFLTGAIT